MTDTMLRERVPAAPRGRRLWSWYGPGLLWMLSSVGTGSILFTPRVASVYRYELFWLLLLVVFFMWVMIREMARYSIVTGRTMLAGMHTLPGPRGWAVWVIFVPQLLAAAVGIAGLNAVVGSALAAFFPGHHQFYGILMLALCTAFTATGRYLKIERFSRVMALVLMATAVVSAGLVLSEVRPLAAGLVPRWPADPDWYVILPWVGTILAGSMGIVWFGYWTATRGYGGGLVSQQSDRERDDEMPAEARAEQVVSTRDRGSREDRVARVRAWNRVMTGAATLGVGGGLLVISAFLVLGAELLAPAGVLPAGPDVAVDLARLFSDVWGEAGKLLLLVAVIVALGGSVLANQDGWGRSFADMTLILMREQRRRQEAGQRTGAAGWAVQALVWLSGRTGLPLFERRCLKRAYIMTVTGLVPLAILLLFRDPVKVMSASGIIAAAHTPFIVILALLVNRRQLPPELRPNAFSTAGMAAAALFYLGFAAVYFWDWLG